MGNGNQRPATRNQRLAMLQSVCTDMAVRLRDLGYLWDIKPDDCRKLTPTCDRFRQAVREYQAFLSLSFAQICAECDPDQAPAVGDTEHPANVSLLRMKRCPMPDSPPPPAVSYHYDNKPLDRAVHRYQRHAAAVAAGDIEEGSGSIPAGCHESRTGYAGHALSIYYDYSRRPARTQQHWPTIQQRTFAAYRAVGLYLFEVEDPDEADCLWEWRNGRGWIGLAEYFGTSCWNQSFLYIDPGYQPGDFIDGQCELSAHELGHTCNEGHQPQSRYNTMSPTIAWPGDFVGWDARDATTPALRRKFSGDYGPMPPIGGPTPTPDPQPEPPDDDDEPPPADVEAIVAEVLRRLPDSDAGRLIADQVIGRVDFDALNEQLTRQLTVAIATELPTITADVIKAIEQGGGRVIGPKSRHALAVILAEFSRRNFAYQMKAGTRDARGTLTEELGLAEFGQPAAADDSRPRGLTGWLPSWLRG